MIPDGLYDVPPGKLAMIVTHLEMRSPKFREAAQPQDLTFTELPADVEIYRDLFRRVGQPWLWFSRLHLDDSALADILNDPFVDLFTLMKNGKPEALLELDFRVKGACELAYFGLTDTLIGTGAGAYLMDRAVDYAFGIRIDRLHVHTCTLDSPGALAFYQRSGFKPVRQQVEICDDPRLTGLLPEDAGPHVPIFRP